MDSGVDGAAKEDGEAPLDGLPARNPRLSGVESSRIFNRRLIYDLLYREGPLSRIDIADRVGLPPQTVSSITRELLDQSLIEEAGRSTGQRGQPQIYLRPNAVAGHSVGVHLDRGGYECILCDLSLRVVARHARPLDIADPVATIARIREDVSRLIAEAGLLPDTLWGVGLVLPTRNDDVYESDMNLPGWDAWRNIDVSALLREACGVPVLVENDATAAAIGERFARGGDEAEDFVCIYVGYGVGAGIVVDGMPVKGRWGNAGELAFLPFPQRADSIYARPMVMDDVLSLTGIASVMGCAVEDLDAARLLKLHTGRNADFMAWMREATEGIRFLVAIVESILDPGFVTLGGVLPTPIIESLVERAYPLPPTLSGRRDREVPRLVASDLGPGAAAAGAASLPIFANINPNFRHLYIRQIATDSRAFDRPK